MEEKPYPLFLRFLFIGLVILFAFLGFIHADLLFHVGFFALLSFSVVAVTMVWKPQCLQSCVLYVLLFFSLVCIVERGVSQSTFLPGCSPSFITRVEGKAVTDEKKLASGNFMVSLLSSCVETREGDSFSSQGMVTLIYPDERLIQRGNTLSAVGEVSEDSESFMKASAVSVLSRGSYDWIWRLGLIRLYAQNQIEKRVPITLGSLLLLGRCDQDGFPLKDAALKSGCAHLLALSGMHLSILTSVFSFVLSLFVRKSLVGVVSLFFPLLFTCIAGPLPSLLRAFLMLLLSTVGNKKGKVHREWVFFFAFFLQIFLFPTSLGMAGTLLSYGAVGSLCIMAIMINHPPLILKPLLPTLFALLVVYPLSTLIGGEWTISALVAAPVGGVLVTAAMIVSLGILFVSFLPYRPLYHVFLLALEKLQDYLFALFHWSVRFKLYVPYWYSLRFGYRFYALTLLTTVSIYLYTCRYLRNRRRKAYELELSV